MSFPRHIIGLLISLLLLFASTLQAAEPDITEEAKRQNRIGIELLKDPAGPRYEEALAAFRAAYAASPSPKILSNIAFCLMNLERDGEAIEVYTQYLEEATAIDEQERTQVENDLGILRSGVVRLTLTVQPPEVQVVDTRSTSQGTKVVNRYSAKDGTLKVGIHAGYHRIRVEQLGYEPIEFPFEAKRGETVDKSVELRPVAKGSGTPEPSTGPAAGSTASPDATERPVPVSVYIGLAATGAFGVAFAVLGGLALSNKGDFDDAQQTGDVQEAQSLSDTGTGLNIAADVMLGATVLAAGLTTILYLTRPEEPVEGTALAISVDPVIGLNTGGLWLRGSF